MSERSRGPEGSSGRATTDRGNASGSEDFYAAAAATVAARNGSSNGGASAAGRDKLTPTARPAQKPAAPGERQSADRVDKADSADKADSKDGKNAKPAARAADSSESENETTAIGAIASQVLNAVRPKSKAEKAEERARNAGPAADLVRNQPAPETKQQKPVPAPAAAAAAAAASPARAEKPRPGTARGTRKARLRLSRLDPWSVMKTAFMFSIAAGIVFVVAVFAVWTVIGSSGLFASVDSIVGSVLQSPGDTTPFRIEDYVNTQKVMGVTAFLACIDVVIFTALATLASFLYNLAATMLGGLEVTLAED